MIGTIIRTVAIAVFLAGVIGAGIFLYGAVIVYPKPGVIAEDSLFYIPSGAATRKVAAELKNAGYIDAIGEKVFLAAAKISGSQIKAGEFNIPKNSSIHDILSLFDSGKTHQRKITIPEGLMSIEIAELVVRAEGLGGDIGDIPPEGSLLPETYSFSRGETRASLLSRMQKSMQETMNREWPLREENLPVATPEDAIVLASVVEKETGIAAERPRVAGVFVNRLRIGMPLQSDPTVIYALTLGKEKLGRPLLRKDLNIESPYNSYVTKGLPPTPIANPGAASIRAVLHPEKHDYLYFVADGSGGHAFAVTHDEHLRNVSNWRQVQQRGKQ